MTLGFIGVGTIASAIVTGLRAAGNDEPIVLSPRNAEAAADLAGRFDGVRVASGNQAVLDASDVVVLAVRPQIAADVLRDLSFRPDHHVLSLIATVSLDDLKSLTAPAATVTRAVPLPSVARRQGPTAVYPPHAPIKALFDSLGVAVALDSEAEFDAFTAASAVMSSYFAVADTVAGWMARHGVAPANARAYVGQMFEGLSGTAAAAPESGFSVLAEEHQTRGGLNEQVLKSITEGGVLAGLDDALDAVLARLSARSS